MTRKSIFCIALASVASLAASPPADARKKETGDLDKVVCKQLPVIGSRVFTRRTCATVVQWEDWRRQNQQLLLEKQFNGAQ